MSKKSRPGDGIFARGRKGMSPAPSIDGDENHSSAFAAVSAAFRGVSKLRDTAEV